MVVEGNPFESPGLEGVRGSCNSDTEVEFDYVQADGMWFALRENRQQQRSQILMQQIVFASCALIFAMFSLLFVGKPETFYIVSLPFLAGAGYFVYRTIFAKRHFTKRVRRLLEKMLASRTSTGVLGQTTIRLEEEGFSIERPGGHMFWRWWAVPEVSTDEGYLLIYTSAVEACLVPSRAFHTDEHFHAFAAKAKQLWNARTSVPAASLSTEHVR